MTSSASSAKINSHKRSFYVRSILLALFVSLIIIFGTLLAYKIPWIYDMTAGKIFTLSPQTKTVVNSLAVPVEIIAVYPQGGADPLISSLLSEYGKAGKMLTVEYVDAEREPGRLANFDFGINAVTNGTILIRSNGKSKFLYVKDMFKNSADGNAFLGESQLTGAIRYVTADILPIAYFLDGHNEASIFETLSTAKSTLESSVYEVKSLTLLKAGKVPEDAAVLIIASPKRDLSGDEFIMVAEYLQKGGKLLYLSDVLSTNTMVLPNFNQVLHKFGIDISNNLIIEEDPFSHVSNNNLYLIPGYAFHPITQELAEAKRYIVLPIAMGLHTLDYDTNLVTLQPLLASSPRSWMRTDMTSTATTKTETDVQGPIPLAYAAIGVDQGYGNGDSQVIVIGNSTFINNENIDSNANRDFFMKCVNWLAGDREEDSISPRIIGADKLIVRGDNFTRLVIISLVIMPLIPFICAFIIWYIRRNQ
jgi:ABC-type uncharacterized transport system involved in gliding motility auxiliary subunit